MRLILTLFLSLSLHATAFCQLPSCKDSLPSSLLLNSSFEEYSNCTDISGGLLEGGYIDISAGFGGIKVPNWHPYRYGREVHYFNYYCKNTKPSGSIFDASSACYYPKVPLPLPEGNGLIAIEQNNRQQFASENKIAKSYLTTCLSQPLYAGQGYVVSFYFGFGKQGICPQSFYQSQNEYGIAIFGRQDCPQYPLNQSDLNDGCLSNNSGWIKLGTIQLNGENEWILGAIEFTPQTNISTIGIGPDCSNHSADADFYYTISMHYLDKLILAPKAEFSFKNITAISGNNCSGNFVLKAPAYANPTYQWYKDGVPIPTATAEIYSVPNESSAAGNYVVNIDQPYNTCLNSLPFPVSFSDLNKFSLGNDTVLCTPAAIQLNATWESSLQYYWQNGSKDPTLTVDKSGIYWVELKDENGCTKKDSITVTIQACEKCDLFIPSAFTPNNDGLNDRFKVTPRCPNISLQNFTMSIFNRWGQLIFNTNDIANGWNGMYKGVQQQSGVYIYFVDYSFKEAKSLQQKGTIALLK